MMKFTNIGQIKIHNLPHYQQVKILNQTKIKISNFLPNLILI
jgi:hypothetical protein